jgi:nucleoside-diphosphate-sugar epimerase
MPKKLLITGGAGFLGFHLCRKLLKKFDKIIVLDIAPLPQKEYDKKIKYYKVDVANKKAVDKVMDKEKPSHVVHAAAGLPLFREEHIKKINVDGTKNMLDASLRNKAKRFVHISSTAVYGVPKKHPLYEDDPLIGVGPYGKTKIIAEKLCQGYRKKGMCVTVIRPKTFIGTERLGVFQILYDWVENGKRIPIIGNGRNRYQLLEVEDLVDAIYLSLTKEKTKVNDTFNIGAKEFNTVKQDVGALCRYAKSGARVMPTPAPLVKFSLRVFEMMKLSPLYKWVYGTANTDSFVSVEKLEKQLGWKPKYSNANALIRSYQWYLDNKHEIQQGTGVTHRIAWSQGILGLFKKFL